MKCGLALCHCFAHGHFIRSPPAQISQQPGLPPACSSAGEVPKTLTCCARSQDPRTLLFCPWAKTAGMDGLGEVSRASYNVLLSHQKLFWSQFRMMKQDASWHRHKKGWSWDLGMWCRGTALSSVVESHGQFAEERRTVQKTPWVAHSSSCKTETPAHLCFGWWGPCAEEWAHYSILCVAAGREGRFGSFLSMAPGF